MPTHNSFQNLQLKELQIIDPIIRDAPICKSTPWARARKISENLFEERKDWLLPSDYLDNNAKGTTSVTSPKPPIKEEPKTEEQPSTSPKTEKCGWGPNCPSAKIKRKKKTGMVTARTVAAATAAPTEGQDDPSKVPQTSELPETQSSQKFDQKTYDGRYPSQLEIHKQWEAEMERRNAKYNLDCFSDSEPNSESDEGEQYKYEHGYETLI